jgi:hypothetical protein
MWRCGFWENGNSTSNATIVSHFEHLGEKRYVEYVEQADIYVVWSNARPLPKTLPLTISELIQIASEVKGCKVILKEDKA